VRYALHYEFSRISRAELQQLLLTHFVRGFRVHFCRCQLHFLQRPMYYRLAILTQAFVSPGAYLRGIKQFE
jgi:hypothetical protein